MGALLAFLGLLVLLVKVIFGLIVICIVGPSRTGKTTHANGLAGPVRHADDLVGRGCDMDRWLAGWLSEPGPWVIEGVGVGRGLREWLRTHALGAPCDEVLRLTVPHVPHTKGQATQAKGEATVWSQVEMILRRRGVAVKEGWR